MLTVPAAPAAPAALGGDVGGIVSVLIPDWPFIWNPKGGFNLVYTKYIPKRYFTVRRSPLRGKTGELVSASMGSIGRQN